MSIDLYLRAKEKPTLKQIEDLISPLGWLKDDEKYGDFPLYWWFKHDNYESIRGAWLSLREPSEDDPPGTRLVFCSGTQMSRSWEDMEAQNLVIKELKARFGGSLWNPQRGVCGYIHNDIPRLSANEKACGLAHYSFTQNIYRAKVAIDDFPETVKLQREDFPDVASLNKEVVRNNTLLSFLVSCFETFLKDMFVAFVNTNDDCRARVLSDKNNRKVEMADLAKILSGDLSLGRYMASNFTFQNLESAGTAYQRFLNIPLHEVLNRRRKIDGRIRRFREVFDEILETRHKIIHDAYLDLYLDREVLEFYVAVLERFVADLLGFLRSERGLRIDLDRYL